MTSLVRCRLRPHTQTPGASVDEVVAMIALEPQGLSVRYRIVGDLRRLRIPGVDARLDTERLWEHTCCEMFVAPVGTQGYVEWNFSPTGQRAKFDFSSYRNRISSDPNPAAEISTRLESGVLQLDARVPRPSVGVEGARVSLTTVVEDESGGLSYWALRHPTDGPDFHHAGGFALALTLTPSPAIVELP